MSFSLQHSVIFCDDVLVQDVGDEKVLLNLNSEEYFGLDPVAATIWEVIKQTDSLQSACDRLLDIYDVAPEQLQQDLLELVEKLINHGLVEVTVLEIPDLE